MSTPPELITVRCNHCGAPLEVAAGARFVTCAHCGAQLEVHRTDSAIYTEVLDQINQRTERMERDLDEIKRQNAIEQLDREWEMRRQTLLVRNKDGSSGAPSAVGGILGGLVAAGFGIFWTVIAASNGSPGVFPLFGVIFTGVAIVGVIFTLIKSSEYGDAEAEYRRRRQELINHK